MASNSQQSFGQRPGQKSKVRQFPKRPAGALAGAGAPTMRVSSGRGAKTNIVEPPQTPGRLSR